MTYTISVTVTGLGGSGLVLSPSAYGDDNAVATNGIFFFSTTFASGIAYDVTVKTQPSAPTQNCVVGNGTGTIGSANVTNVTVSCAPGYSLVGASVFMLRGSGLVLQSNGGDDLAVQVSSSDTQTFATPLPVGADFTVTVKSQPSAPTQYCGVVSGTVTVGPAATYASVLCGDYSVGGTVTGLTGTLELYSNLAGDYATRVNANGPFTFVEPFASGSTYHTYISGQPLNQHCVVDNWYGTVQTSNVTSIAVKCVNVGPFAFAANARDDTVSAYSINSTTGALAALGTPVATGTSPHVIATDPYGGYVYVGNEASNDISAFRVSPASGALQAIPGSPFAAGTGPQALAFDPSDTFLYVADNGSNDLSVYFVDPQSGVLSPWYAPYATGTGPAAVAVAPTGKFVYVANNGGSNDISVYAINQGQLTPVAGSPFAAGDSPHGLVFAASGKFLYTANSGGTNSTISGFSVDPSSGALNALSGSPFTLAVDHSMAADRTGRYLYVTTDGGVVGYGIDHATGALSALAGFPVAAGANAYSVTFDQTNQFLYVGIDGAAAVSGFRFDAATGGLTPMPGSPFPAGNLPDSVATL
jgi:6-phosphogluconolactonase (cycloisomerase 2 family)